MPLTRTSCAGKPSTICNRTLFHRFEPKGRFERSPDETSATVPLLHRGIKKQQRCDVLTPRRYDVEKGPVQRKGEAQMIMIACQIWLPL